MDFHFLQHAPSTFHTEKALCLPILSNHHIYKVILIRFEQFINWKYTKKTSAVKTHFTNMREREGRERGEGGGGREEP